jgi:hypothetical protein
LLAVTIGRFGLKDDSMRFLTGYEDKVTFDVGLMIFGFIMVGIPIVRLTVGTVFDMNHTFLLLVEVSSIWIFHLYL